MQAPRRFFRWGAFLMFVGLWGCQTNDTDDPKKSYLSFHREVSREKPDWDKVLSHLSSATVESFRAQGRRFLAMDQEPGDPLELILLMIRAKSYPLEEVTVSSQKEDTAVLEIKYRIFEPETSPGKLVREELEVVRENHRWVLAPKLPQTLLMKSSTQGGNHVGQ